MAAVDRITEDADGNLVVQQSLASKLDSIIAGLVRVETTLASKADRSDMARVDGDLVALTIRVTTLENQNREQAAATNAVTAHADRRFTRQQKTWGVIGAVTLILATAFGPLIANGIH